MWNYSTRQIRFNTVRTYDIWQKRNDGESNIKQKLLPFWAFSVCSSICRRRSISSSFSRSILSFSFSAISLFFFSFSNCALRRNQNWLCYKLIHRNICLKPKYCESTKKKLSINILRVFIIFSWAQKTMQVQTQDCPVTRAHTQD